MAKINRLNANVEPFGSTATGVERTVFGDETTQSDTLDANVTSLFLRGWGILAAGAKPPKQFFNGLTFAITQFIAYLHQAGVPEWNINQEYHFGSFVNVVGVLYVSKTDTNTGNDPLADTVNWRKNKDSTIRSVTITGAVLSSDEIIIIDATAGAVTLTLLPADEGSAIKIQRSRGDSSGNTVDIEQDGADTIALSTDNLTLFPGEGYELIPDGVSDYLQF